MWMWVAWSRGLLLNCFCLSINIGISMVKSQNYKVFWFVMLSFLCNNFFFSAVSDPSENGHAGKYSADGIVWPKSVVGKRQGSEKDIEEWLHKNAIEEAAVFCNLRNSEEQCKHEQAEEAIIACDCPNEDNVYTAFPGCIHWVKYSQCSKSNCC